MIRTLLTTILSLPISLVGAIDETAPVAVDEGRLARAGKLLENGNADKAREIFEALLADGMEDGRVHFGLGRSLAMLGEWSYAVDEMVVASKLLSDNFDVVLGFAQTLYEKALADVANEDYESAGYGFLDARRVFEQAAALRPDSSTPWFQAARVERDRGDPEESIALFVKGLEISPDDAGALIELASLRFGNYYALLAEGKMHDAKLELDRCRELYQHVLSVDPNNGYALNGQAWLARVDHNEELAVKLFGDSLLKNPTLDDSYRNLAAAYEGDRNGRKTWIAQLDDVVRESARYAEKEERKRGRGLAFYYRGLAHKADRSVAKATSDFEQATKLLPELDVACKFQLACAFLRDMQQDEAIQALAPLAESDFDTVVGCVLAEPDGRALATSFRGLVQRCFEANALEHARLIAKVTAHALGNSPDDWNNFAFFCRETAHYEEAYEAYQYALELNPTDPNILNDTALILQYHLGREIDYAADLYEQSIAEGNRVLSDPQSDSFAQESARVAVRDATNNLKLLKGGVYVGGPKDPANRRAGGEGKKREKDAAERE